VLLNSLMMYLLLRGRQRASYSQIRQPEQFPQVLLEAQWRSQTAVPALRWKQSLLSFRLRLGPHFDCTRPAIS